MTGPLAARATRGFLFAILAGLVFQGLNTSVKLLVAGRDTPAQVGLAVLAGLFGTVAYFFLTWAFRLLDLSAVQPLMFLGIVWASLADVAFFGTTADAWTFVGAAVVVAASTMLVGKETRR